MSIGVAQSLDSSRADHSVALGRIVLKILHGIVPLAQISIAQSGIELSQVAGISRTVVIGNLHKATVACAITIEGLVELLGIEVLLTTSQCSTGFLLPGTPDKRAIAEISCDND